MEANEAYRALAAALRRMHVESERRDRELSALRAELDELTGLLVSRGQLAAGHRQSLHRVGERAARKLQPAVKLGPPIDKYAMTGDDVDCLARLPLCRGRCCTFTFALTLQDLEEAIVPWEVEQPYLVYHEADGYCALQDRTTRTCTVHDRRPFACRSYTCHDDPRIWLDFEARVPVPMPEGPRASVTSKRG